MSNIIVSENIDDRIRTAISSENTPKLYANGFVSFVGQSDIGIILEYHNNPIAVVSMSYTLAKTLVEKLGNVIHDIEDRTGNAIMTTDNFISKLNTENPNETDKQ